MDRQSWSQRGFSGTPGTGCDGGVPERKSAWRFGGLTRFTKKDLDDAFAEGFVEEFFEPSRSGAS